jgi:methylase of polypeptide subunit release factors
VTDETSTTFGSLTVRYSAAGLSPRRWTQLQSAWAAELLAGLPAGDVLELCAGVGHIGLLALVEAGTDLADGHRRRLVQVDTGEEVCALAELNAGLAGLADRVDVRRGLPQDVLDPAERFVLVIADPPWVPTDRVGDHPDDPPAAIDGGPDGLDVVRALLPVLERHLQQPGAALLQVGGRGQARAVEELLLQAGSRLRALDSREAPPPDAGAVVLLQRPG